VDEVVAVIGQFSVNPQDCEAMKAALVHKIEIEHWVEHMDIATITKALDLSNEYKKQGHIDTVVRQFASLYPEIAQLEVFFCLKFP
jgi:hypothetical protein